MINIKNGVDGRNIVRTGKREAADKNRLHAFNSKAIIIGQWEKIGRDTRRFPTEQREPHPSSYERELEGILRLDTRHQHIGSQGH